MPTRDTESRLNQRSAEWHVWLSEQSQEEVWPKSEWLQSTFRMMVLPGIIVANVDGHRYQIDGYFRIQDVQGRIIVSKVIEWSNLKLGELVAPNVSYGPTESRFPLKRNFNAAYIHKNIVLSRDWQFWYRHDCFFCIAVCCCHTLLVLSWCEPKFYHFGIGILLPEWSCIGWNICMLSAWISSIQLEKSTICTSTAVMSTMWRKPAVPNMIEEETSRQRRSDSCGTGTRQEFNLGLALVFESTDARLS